MQKTDTQRALKSNFRMMIDVGEAQPDDHTDSNLKQRRDLFARYPLHIALPAAACRLSRSLLQLPVAHAQYLIADQTGTGHGCLLLCARSASAAARRVAAAAAARAALLRDDCLAERLLRFAVCAARADDL